MPLERAKTPVRFIYALAHLFQNIPQVCEACGLDSGRLHEGLFFRYKIVVCADCVNSPPLEPPMEPGTDQPLPFKPYPLDVFRLAERYSSVTKTTAQKDYLLSNEELENIPHFIAKNPHSISYSSMKLYLLAHVAGLSSKKYGSLKNMRQVKGQREFVKMDKQIKLRAQHEREELLIQQCYEKGLDQNATYLQLFAEQTRFKAQFKQEQRSKRAQLAEELKHSSEDDQDEGGDESSGDDHDANADDKKPNDDSDAFFELDDYDADDDTFTTSSSTTTTSTSTSTQSTTTNGAQNKSKPPKQSRYEQEVDLISSWFDPPAADTSASASHSEASTDVDSDLECSFTAPPPSSKSSKKSTAAPSKPPSNPKTALPKPQPVAPKKRKQPNPVSSSSSSSSSSDDDSDSVIDLFSESDDIDAISTSKSKSKPTKRQKVAKTATPPPKPPSSKPQPAKKPPAAKKPQRKTKANSALSLSESLHVHDFVYQDGYEVCECGAKIEVEFL